MSPVRLDVLTIFPAWFDGPLTTSLLGRAIADGVLDVRVHDLRDWTTDRHRSVDDAPYGGGAGMVMRADVWIDACEAVWNDLDAEVTRGRTVRGDVPTEAFAAGGVRPRTVLLTPRGRPLTQALATELAAEERLVLLCGRYEGIDERVHELVATDEVSVGDYVLFGGEVAAAALIEAVTRLVPGVVGNEASPAEESFTSGLLEYPHYTRPAEVRGHRVPEVLTSGDHAAVGRWRHQRSVELTRQRRPDLLGGTDTAEGAGDTAGPDVPREVGGTGATAG
ncbi:MAG: tRNA (guanosine(37)-N1)-methyltransferase TrmD [Nitriliruptoraceae bacterium]